MNAATVSPNVQSADDDILYRGNLYAEGLYARTDVARGVTRNRLGTRLCALSSDFLIGLRRAITEECGSAAELVFKTCGTKWGRLYARRFEKELSEFYGRPLAEFTMATFMACLVELFSHHGWGKLRLDLDRYDKGLLLVELDNAIMAGLVQTAEQPVDTLFAGIFAGFFAELTGQDLDCVQTTCAACGAPTSRFIIGLRTRLESVPGWLQEGQSHDVIVTALDELRC